MPLFDFYCKQCGKEMKDELIRDKKDLPMCCGTGMYKKVPTGIISGFPQFGLTLNHVDTYPVHFDTKKQLRDYKRKHNLDLGALPND